MLRSREAAKATGGNPFSYHVSPTIHIMYPGLGIATDRNLQFVFDINLPGVINNHAVFKDMTIKLSKELQRSYNYDVEERHYIKGTTEFPWHQLADRERHIY